MASSCSSSNVTHTLFAEEKLDGKYLVKKIADVKDSLKRVRKAIREMEIKIDKEAWTDSLDCFKDNKIRLEVKLSRLTQLEYENAEGVKELRFILLYEVV
ncbi:hypothetical protein Tco_0155771 [Tanacetum coccineum]